MSGGESFDQALDAAIDALRRGAPLADVLAAHAEHAAELAPLLHVTASLEAAAAPPPPSARLAQNFRDVRAAVHRAQAARGPGAPWWRRPVSFASLSVPAGLLALAAIGAAGAAAGGAVAVTRTRGDLPARVHEIVTFDFGSAPAATPRTATSAAGSGEATAATHGTEAAGAPAGGGMSTPERGGGVDLGTRRSGEGGTPAVESTAGAGMPHDEGTPSPGGGAPVAVVVSGTIKDVEGRTFTLRTPTGDWHVQTDSQTTINGVIATDAGATVSGVSGDGKDIQATRVDVTAPPAGAPTPGPTRPPGDHEAPDPTSTPMPGGMATVTPKKGD
ncbi:MAG: hypothetical protein KGK07_02430 [Chloroflexota bacterium]|nr:hypothetical protein [Chloroflexota bacterium]